MNPMNNRFSIPLSILDLVMINDNGTAGMSMINSLDLAQKAETWGYRRYWLAEHHNIPGIASSATSVLIAFIAGGTNSIRVGSGGVMLPNHSPLIIAEQFGTLESLLPGRIDLGMGRAPGTDRLTSIALRKRFSENPEDSEEGFPNDVREIMDYLEGNSSNHVNAIPGKGLSIPIWLLGSSTFSAGLAAELGLPFAFAGHFAPEHLDIAINNYRKNFRPSKYLKEPYVLVSINVVVADTDYDAQILFTSAQTKALGLIRRKPDLLKPPSKNMNKMWNEFEKYTVDQRLKYSFVGAPQKVKSLLQNFLQIRLIDELMVVSHIYDHDARLKSYQLLSSLYL
jgi:luciferase family oxidoreductase group 1